MVYKKRQTTEIRIPIDIFNAMTEISIRINMKFSTLLKVMMNNGVNKHLLTGQLDIPVDRRFPKDEKDYKININQTQDWKEIKKKARAIRIYASEVLAVLLELEIEECNKTKHFTIKIV